MKIIKNMYLQLFLIFFASMIYAETTNIHIPFIKNNNLYPKNIFYFTKTYNGNVFIDKKGEIIYSVNSVRFVEKFNIKNINVKSVEKSNVKVNFLYGNNANNWREGMETDRIIRLNDNNSNIEVLLKSRNNNIEKIFMLKPGVSLKKCRASFSKDSELHINASGELTVLKYNEELKFSKPVAYQYINGNKVFYPCSYILTGDYGYGFDVNGYNENLPLFIDPLISSVYIGGTEDDVANDIVIDNNGYIYITGSTLSSYFPVTKYSADKSINGGKDVFVCKLDSNLQLISATFLGGAGNDTGNSIAVDKSNNIYIIGETFSSNFPVIPGNVQTVFKGVSDAFIIKLDSSLSSVLSSTFLGGGYEDIGEDIVIDSDGAILVTGETDSTDFPVSATAPNSVSNGYRDIFVAKLNDSLTILSGSTFVGGEFEDYAGGIATDSENNIYVAASNVKESGYEDLSIYKFNSALTSLVSEKNISGKYDDVPTDIIIDKNDNIFVTGYTQSGDFPVTSTAFDTSFNGGAFDKDGFILKTNKNLSILYSTFFGGNNDDVPSKAVLGIDGGIYVTGHTKSGDFPVDTIGYDTTINGYNDIFIIEFADNLASIEASTFIGGNLDDFGTGIIADKTGNVFITGYSESNNFPVTNQSTEKGNDDVIISKLTSNLSFSVLPDGQVFTLVFASSGEWKLCSVPLNSELSVTKFSNAKTVWKWDANDKSWKIWSPVDSIKNLISQYGMKTFNTLVPGEGFWINSNNNLSFYLSGNNYGLENASVVSGWNLLGTGKDISVSEITTKDSSVKSVWKWSNGAWKIWSPVDSIKNLISQYSIDTFTTIEQGVGFWVNK